jgi:DNA-binding NarL/FixJ family response regulator
MPNSIPQTKVAGLIDGDLILTPLERAHSEFLVIESDNQDRDSIRKGLKTIGVNKVYVTSDHYAGLNAIQLRHFTHIIFTCNTTNMSAAEFIRQALELSPRAVAVASSSEPQADDVFDLLRLGARGFLVKPFSGDALDSAIVLATKGNPLPDAVLHAKNRNEAFAALMAAAIDKCSDLLRQSAQYNSAKIELAQSRAKAHNIVRIARMFSQGGEEKLLESIVTLFISISEGPATQLGRLRHRLKQKRIQQKESVIG